MAEQSAVRRRKAVELVRVVPAEAFVGRRNEIHDMISRRAHARFEIRGGAPGRDLEDWLIAELHILHACRHTLKESLDALIVNVVLPGPFTPDQLAVCVEPHRLTISGERTISMLVGDSDGTHTELRPQRIFQTEDLSVEVDPSSATAQLKDESLEIVMPKMTTSKAA